MSEIAAALAVVLRGDRVLLVRRAHRPDAGLWGFSGGRIEPGETPEAAALRELREETGLTGRFLTGLGQVVFAAGERRYRLHAGLCSAPDGRAVAADDAEEATWAGAARVVAGLYPCSRDVPRLTLRAMHRLRKAAVPPG